MTATVHLDPQGSPTLPDMPRLSIQGDTVPSAEIEAILSDAQRQGTSAVSTGWDPMDASGLQTLESLGFKPAGTMPWRPMGNAVHWVTGYEDATGAILDLIWRAPCPNDGA